MASLARGLRQQSAPPTKLVGDELKGVLSEIVSILRKRFDAEDIYADAPDDAWLKVAIIFRGKMSDRQPNSRLPITSHPIAYNYTLEVDDKRGTTKYSGSFLPKFAFLPSDATEIVRDQDKQILSTLAPLLYHVPNEYEAGLDKAKDAGIRLNARRKLEELLKGDGQPAEVQGSGPGVPPAEECTCAGRSSGGNVGQAVAVSGAEGPAIEVARQVGGLGADDEGIVDKTLEDAAQKSELSSPTWAKIIKGRVLAAMGSLRVSRRANNDSKFVDSKPPVSAEMDVSTPAAVSAVAEEQPTAAAPTTADQPSVSAFTRARSGLRAAWDRTAASRQKAMGQISSLAANAATGAVGGLTAKVGLVALKSSASALGLGVAAGFLATAGKLVYQARKDDDVMDQWHGGNKMGAAKTWAKKHGLKAAFGMVAGTAAGAVCGAYVDGEIVEKAAAKLGDAFAWVSSLLNKDDIEAAQRTKEALKAQLAEAARITQERTAAALAEAQRLKDLADATRMADVREAARAKAEAAMRASEQYRAQEAVATSEVIKNSSIRETAVPVYDTAADSNGSADGVRANVVSGITGDDAGGESGSLQEALARQGGEALAELKERELIGQPELAQLVGLAPQ